MEENLLPEPQKNNFWNPDKIVSFSAVFISLAALIVLIYQTNLMSQQQKLSVLPYLNFQNHGTLTPNYSLVVANNGIGPAFVESVNVTYKGKTYNTDLIGFLENHLESPLNLTHLFHSNLGPGVLIPAQTNIEHLRIMDSQEDAEKLYDLLQNLYSEGLNFEIVFSSIYKEKWKIQIHELAPEKMN
jgi:hypothetical protein